MPVHRIMKRGIPLLAVALILGSIVFARPAVTADSAQPTDERLVKIRALWAEIQKRIDLAFKEAENGSPAGFYCSEVIVNSHNGSWRGSGTYYKKTAFWYTDQPGFAGESGPASVLAKVEIQEIVAAKTFYKEFLFDQGKLVFATTRNPDVPGEAGEFRYYFSDGALFRYMEGQKVITAKPDIRAIQAEAKGLQTLFLATF